MKLACRAVPLMALGLLAGAGCSEAPVPDGGSGSSSGTSTGGTTSAGSTSGGTTGGTSGTTSGGTSGGTTGGGDAGPDLSCAGLPLPTTAPAMLNLGGTVNAQSSTGSTPLSGATVEIFQSGGGASFGTATTDASGAFTMTVPSGGAPLDAYFHVTATGYPDVYWYPPAPFFFDYPNVPISMISSSTLGLLSYIGGGNQQAGKGQVGLEVLDCGGAPIAGAVVTSNPPAGKTAYIVGIAPSPTATSTDSSGTAFLFNVTPGPVSLGATLGSTTLRAHSVTVRGDPSVPIVTETSVAP